MALLLNADQLTTFLHGAFPDGHHEDRMRVEAITDDAITMRMRIDAANLRPGATVSGPTLFSLVDAAAWLMTLAHLGEGRDAVTSGVTIHYLRRPAPADLRAEGRLLKLGRRLSITDVLVFSDGIDAPVAQATVTYAPV